MNYIERTGPAVALLLIAPLIAEFLLGDFNIQQLGYLAIFVPLYGAGALLIREAARRVGRGWPTMLCLGLAYALVLEGLVNQTLFNPHYAGQDLIGYGFIPVLGTSLNYATFILTLHTVWSVSAPIAIAEGLAGKRSQEPWLRLPELIAIAALCLLGLLGTAVSTIERFHFISSPTQYAVTGLLVFVLAVAAFRIFRAPVVKVQSGKAPSVWLVFAVAFGLSSMFQIWFHFAPDHKLDNVIGLIVFLMIDLAALMAFAFWSRREGWGAAYIVAAAAGAVLTYGWFGLRRLLVSAHTALGVETTPVDVMGQVGLLAGLLGLCMFALRIQDRVET